MGLILARRTALIGNSISINTQHHGEEDVAALYVPISQFPVTADELPEVMLEPKAYKLLYRKWKGRPDEPVWGKVVPSLPFGAKVKGWTATLFLGRRQLKVLDATLTRIKLLPQTGGVSQLSFQLQCVPDLDESHPLMEALLARVNQQIDLELSCDSYGAQPELPLEEKDDDGEDEGDEAPESEPEGEDEGDEAPESEPEGEDDEGMSGLGRQIGRSSRKRGRRDEA